ncbi:MAG: hypothetical protein VCB07_02050 [Gammaproteobacteria bacterium]
MQNDESVEVRKTAVTSIGQHGVNSPLSNLAIEALSSQLLAAKDDGHARGQHRCRGAIGGYKHPF